MGQHLRLFTLFFALLIPLWATSAAWATEIQTALVDFPPGPDPDAPNYPSPPDNGNDGPDLPPTDPDEPGGGGGNDGPDLPPTHPDEPGGGGGNDGPDLPPTDPGNGDGDEPGQPPTDPDNGDGGEPGQPPTDPGNGDGDEPGQPPTDPDNGDGDEPGQPPTDPDNGGGDEPDPPHDPDDGNTDEPDSPQNPDDGDSEEPQDPGQPDDGGDGDDDSEEPGQPDDGGDGDDDSEEPGQPDDGGDGDDDSEEPGQPDDGDNNEDDGQEDGEDSEEEPDDQPDQGDSDDDDDDREWTSKLKPVFNLNVDWWERIVNQTPHDDQYARPELVKEDYDENRDTLVVWDYRNGFEVTQYHNIRVDLGVINQWYYKNRTNIEDYLWAQIGLIGTVGEEMTVTRFTDTLAQAKQLPRLQAPPRHAREVDHWKVGEHITYISHGGLVFTAGGGLGPIGAGVTALAQGSWKTYIQKLEDNQVYIKLSKAKLRSLGVYASARFVGIDVNHFSNEDDGFSFTLDLNTETGRRAFHDALGGNLVAIQEMATDENIPEVDMVDTFVVTSNGWFSRFFIGIPYLGTTWSQGKIYTISRSHLYVDDSEIDVHYGMYFKTRHTRVIGWHHGRTEAFYGAHYNVNTPGKESVSQSFAKYSFHAYNDESNHERVRTAMKELTRKMGFLGRMTLNIPTLRDYEYTGLHFDLELSDEQTTHLLGLPSRHNLTRFREMVLHQLNTYFNYGSDEHDICADYTENLRRCRHELSHEILVASNKVYKAIAIMNQTQDWSKYTKAYAELGQAMLTNMFMVQAILDAAGPGTRAVYLIEGEKLSKYRREFTYAPATQTWQRTTSSSGDSQASRIRIRVKP